LAPQEKVLDLVLLEDEGDADLKLMLVTQRGDAGNGSGVETCLQIRQYPAFGNVLYELQVSRL
jgi:hypothetical protein